MQLEKKKHVLMLVENYPYPQDTRVRAEARALRDAGLKVSVICPAGQGQPRRETLEGVEVYRFPAPMEASGFWGYVWEFSYCTAVMFVLSLMVGMRGPIDVIHAANPPDMLAFIAAFHKIFGTRFIFDHHDLSPELYDANKGGAGNRLVFRTLVWLERFSCRLADHVIATNESYKRIEMQRSGLPGDRITVVRNGPDLNRLVAPPSTQCRKPTGKTVITYVGTLGYHDGLDHLLLALNHLVVDLRRTDFLCVIVGKGEVLERSKITAAQLGLDPYIQFTGWISESEKILRLCESDICVDPDPWNPFNDVSTMIKVAEYMTFAKPVVAFDLRENRYTAGDAGLFAAANDDLAFARALAELMDDAPRRRVMGAIGRRRVETELAWTHSVRHLFSAYEAVLGATAIVLPPVEHAAMQEVSRSHVEF